MLKTKYKAIFRCMDCNSEFSLDEILFRCPKCNGLLDVVHDIDAIQETSPLEWKQIFESRFRQAKHPYSSGVWGKKEWVLPELHEDHIVSLGEGGTPLVPVPRFSKKLNLENLWIKQCGISHTGSFKDLGMTVLVSKVKELIEKGKYIKAISCASTGDTSAALASYASYANIPVLIFLPKDRISLAQLIQPIANGAYVFSIDTDFDGCMKIVQEITSNPENGIYLANSMNPLRIEGQKTVGIEVIQQLGWYVPDWFLIPGGNLGNVSALVEGFKLLYETKIISKIPRVAVAQSHNANPFYKSYLNRFLSFEPVQAKKTLASAIQIGNPVSFKRAKRALEYCNGVVEEVTEEELANTSAYLDTFGMFTDPHTGVALASLIKLKQKGIIEEKETVVVISTAHGLKFVEFKVQYHKKELPNIHSQYVNQPIMIEPEITKIQEKIQQLFS